jgi:hypothetical protein
MPQASKRITLTCRNKANDLVNLQDDLLREGVRKYAKGDDIQTANKIPWTKVAEYLQKHKASYNFSISGCSKRWDEVVRHVPM